MRQKIIYRHWQPGDDDAVLELLVPSGQLSSEGSYRSKFNNWPVEAEGIRLALVNGKVVGHVHGIYIPSFVEEKVQKIGVVGLVHVAPNMRRQGIATRLMQDLNTYFERNGYRGSMLETDEEAAVRLYQKVGYRQFTQRLQTLLPPSQSPGQLKWREVNLKDLDVCQQLDKKWATQNFPASYDLEGMRVHQYNMRGYRVLQHGGRIVGYAEWGEPSEYRPHGSIRDPIVPDLDPMEVIASIQAAIPATRMWETAEGGRYQEHLRSCGCTFESTNVVIMLLPFGQEIDLTGHHRTAWW